MTEVPVGQRLTDTSESPTPRVLRGVETWETVVSSFHDRLEQAGFDLDNIPAPESEEFPKFLADVQERDPVLAAELARTLRRFRDAGNLPSTHAASSRDRKRKAKQAVIMRKEGNLFVFDKRKAPLYGLAALFFIFGPVMYFLSRPPATAPEAKKSVTPEEGVSTVEGATPGAAARTSAQGATGATGTGTTQQTRPTLTITNPAGTAATTRTEGNAPASASTSTTPANSNLDAFAREQSASSQASTSTATRNAPDRGSTIAPPMVTPPPVSSSTSNTSSTPVSNVYRPVPVTPARPSNFGNTIPNETASYTPPVSSRPPQTFPVNSTPSESVSAPVALTPAPVAVPATSDREDAFGSGISTSRPATALSTPNNTASQATSTPISSSARPVTPAVNAAPSTSSTKAPVSIPAPAATVPSTTLKAATPTASTRAPEAPFGAGINQPAPTGVGTMNATVPTAGSSEVPDRPVTSGLIYQRKRPEATPNQDNMTLASANTTMATTASAAPAPSAAGEGVTFGAMGAAAPTGADSAAANTAPAETPFGGTATNGASKIGALGPYKNLQQVPVRLVTAVYALTSGSVPVVVVTPEGGSFVGVGTINGQLARVDMAFRRYVDPQGQVFEVDALAYTVEGKNLTQGVPASISPVAPTLALDAAQNGASALQAALTTALSNTGNAPKIAIGDGASISSNALPPLWQILAGGVGQTFALPKATQSISRIAKVDSNTQMVLILGIGASQ